LALRWEPREGDHFRKFCVKPYDQGFMEIRDPQARAKKGVPNLGLHKK